METKHTPGPWKTGPRMSRVVIQPPGWNVDMCVADCDAKYAPESEDEKCANAAFIVRACNNFDELLAACEEAYKLDAIDNGALYEAWKKQLLAKLQAAIAKAKGE